MESYYWEPEFECDEIDYVMRAINAVKNATSEQLTWYTDEDQHEYCVSKTWLIEQLFERADDLELEYGFDVARFIERILA